GRAPPRDLAFDLLLRAPDRVAVLLAMIASLVANTPLAPSATPVTSQGGPPGGPPRSVQSPVVPITSCQEFAPCLLSSSPRSPPSRSRSTPSGRPANGPSRRCTRS